MSGGSEVVAPLLLRGEPTVATAPRRESAPQTTSNGVCSHRNSTPFSYPGSESQAPLRVETGCALWTGVGQGRVGSRVKVGLRRGSRDGGPVLAMA